MTSIRSSHLLSHDFRLARRRSKQVPALHISLYGKHHPEYRGHGRVLRRRRVLVPDLDTPRADGRPLHRRFVARDGVSRRGRGRGPAYP